MSAVEIMRREIADVYTTPAEQAAYRAGMSTAFGICDELAAEIERDNTKSGGRIKSAAVGLIAVAKKCGDRIFAARQELCVDVAKTDAA